MADMFDNIDWHDLGEFSSIGEEFEEDAIEYLRIETEFEKDNNELQNET